MIHIVYQSRIEGEIVVAKFESELEAEKFMLRIKETRPRAYPYHSMKVVTESKWTWQDSGIEQGF